MYNLKNKKGFVSFIGFLLTVIISCILFYYAWTIYFGNPVGDTAVKKTLSQQGIDTSSQMGVYSGLVQQIKGIEKQQIEDSENLAARYQNMLEGQ